MNNLTIAQLIQSGAHDAELDIIENALRTRQHIKQSQLRTQLVKGQEIWFNDKVNPQYLRGRRIRVEEVNRVRISVRLVNGSQGGRFHGIINCQLDQVVHIKPNYAAD